jgi:hypothetical protein
MHQDLGNADHDVGELVNACRNMCYVLCSVLPRPLFPCVRHQFTDKPSMHIVDIGLRISSGQ